MAKTEILCPYCDHKPFRNEFGLVWHLEHIHGVKPEDKSRSIDLHSPKATLHQEPVPSAEALERMDDLASRLFGVEGTVAELKGVQKHYQDEVQSRITPLDNRITKSVQETQRAIKGLETKQVSNEAEVRRFTRRLDSTAEKVDSFRKSVDKLEKELFNAIDSHSHEVATLPNSRKQAKVNRSKTLREIIAELAWKGIAQPSRFGRGCSFPVTPVPIVTLSDVMCQHRW